MVIGIAIIAVFAALTIYFRQIIGPLLLAFILAFLLHPLVNRLSSGSAFSWRMAVNLIYLVVIIILVGALTVAGFALLQQIQSLVDFVNRFINDLPALVSDIGSKQYQIGPFLLDFSHFDLSTVASQLLNIVRPLMGQAGNLVSKLATTTVAVVGWGVFVLLISYFLLSESGRLPESLVPIQIPGYKPDTQRLGRELTFIWNAFFRGQLIISILIAIVYWIALTALGMKFTLAIALMAAAARFVPWIGPATTWFVTTLVALLQSSNYFGLQPVTYAALVLVTCLLIDQVFDNFVVPRLMGRTLGLHPAGVLISAILLSRMIGIVGLVLAAPVLATLTLVGRYVVRKMLDLDPWPEIKRREMEVPGSQTIQQLKTWWQSVLNRLRRRSP
jgi:predicted PurR-regulated permease PerM